MSKTTINFDQEFKEQENQVYIAISGNKQTIIEELQKIIKDMDNYTKPIQKNVVGLNYHTQVITPIWNNKEY